MSVTQVIDKMRISRELVDRIDQAKEILGVELLVRPLTDGLMGATEIAVTLNNRRKRLMLEIKDCEMKITASG